MKQDSSENFNDKTQTLVYHLEALRSVLIKSLAALGIGLVPMFLCSPYALDFLTARIVEECQTPLHYFSPMEVFFLQLKLSLLFDVIICFPYIAYQIWKFITPALYENEQKFIRSTVLLSSLLFASGVCFCLVTCIPIILKFGLSFSDPSLQPIFSVENVVSLAIWLSLAFGCMFQFPLVTYALIRTDIVEYKTIASKRPYVLIVILVISALLTPPDIISQVILATPTYLLFEIGLFFSKFHTKKLNEEN